MALRRCRALWLAIGAFLGAATPATVEAASVADIARYSGSDRRAVLEAGARQEGELIIYMTGTQMQPLVDAFQKRFPYVRARIVRGDTATINRRVLEEYRAQTYIVDAFELSVEGLAVLRDQGFLEPFKSPETASFEKEAIEPSNYWVSARETYVGVGYNTKKIPDAQAPRTYDDLLNPSLRGRMAVSNSTSTGANWVGAMVLSKGEDFVRKLGAQQIRVYAIDGRALSNLMIAGEVDISPATYLAQVVASNAQGASLGWVAPGPVYVLDTGTALAAKAPHPHAAMLLIDFLLSKDGQLMYRDIGYLSARGDMPPSALDVKEKLFLANRPSYLEDYTHWAKIFEDVFVTARKP
jgi:iron(III) transport system substrate-binding protein